MAGSSILADSTGTATSGAARQESIDGCRTDVWSKMVTALAAVREGIPAGLHLAGPVGTGKSRLAFDLIEVATDAGFVVSHACPSDRQFEGKPSVIDELFAAANESPMTAARGPSAMHEINRILTTMHNGRPVLAVVDDAQNTDATSLETLVRFLTRCKSILILLVTTEGAVAAHPTALRNLINHPRVTAVRLGNLSLRETIDFAEKEFSAKDPEATGRALHDSTGGNPALLRALVYDSRRIPFDPDGGAVVNAGRAYVDAVQTCVSTLGPSAQRTALALAAVGGDLLARHPQAAVGTAGQLIDVHLHALADGGIIKADGNFRRLEGQRAVLDLAGGADTAAVRYNVARAMYEAGEGAVEVAEQLREAMPVHEPWAVSTLVDASETLQQQGRHGQAIEFLELALHCSTDDNFKSIFQSRHATLAWQAGPAHLKRVLSQHRSSPPAPGTPITTHSLLFLLWQGDFDALLAHLKALDAPGATPLGCADLELLRCWVTSTYPQLLHHFPHPEPSSAARTLVRRLNAATMGLPDRMRTDSAKLLSSVLTGGRTDHAVGQAEQVLERLTFSDSSSLFIETAMFSVMALIYADELHAADVWSRQICSRPQVINSPTWHAQALCSRGMVAMRRGGLREALEKTTQALRLLPPASWGVGVGAPLATLIEIHTRSGDLDAAAELLQIPVKPAMMETRFGIHYLIARGEYLLAAGRPHSALTDFEYCGEYMSTWGIDVGGLALWRLHSARAHVTLGNHPGARKLVRDQMLRIPGKPSRSRGFALRTAALVSSLDHRKQLLSDACDAYDAAGDRLGHVDALTELAECLADLGERSEARQVARRAKRGRTDCLPDVAKDTPPTVVTLLRAASDSTAWSSDDDAVLSDSETKVATLAAKGFTNREIARDLFITVSTVEQHLTRTYRKLGLERRSQLNLVDLPNHATTED